MPAITINPDSTMEDTSFGDRQQNATQATVTTALTIDPNKKVVVLAMNSLFGYCRFNEDFNDRNMNLIKEMKDNGCTVVLTYPNNSWQETAQQTHHLVKTDAYENQPYPNGSYADIPRELGADPKNALFIAAGIDIISAMMKEGLTVCDACVLRPQALVSDEMTDVYTESRADFEKIKQALKAFVS